MALTLSVAVPRAGELPLLVGHGPWRLHPAAAGPLALPGGGGTAMAARLIAPGGAEVVVTPAVLRDRNDQRRRRIRGNARGGQLGDHGERDEEVLAAPGLGEGRECGERHAGPVDRTSGDHVLHVGGRAELRLDAG